MRLRWKGRGHGADTPSLALREAASPLPFSPMGVGVRPWRKRLRAEGTGRQPHLPLGLASLSL